MNQAYNEEGTVDASQLLKQAIELAPDYAPAHAFLGFYLIQCVINQATADPVGDREKALAAVERADAACPRRRGSVGKRRLGPEQLGQTRKSCTHLATRRRNCAFQSGGVGVPWAGAGLARGPGGPSGSPQDFRPAPRRHRGPPLLPLLAVLQLSCLHRRGALRGRRRPQPLGAFRRSRSYFCRACLSPMRSARWAGSTKPAPNWSGSERTTSTSGSTSTLTSSTSTLVAKSASRNTSKGFEPPARLEKNRGRRSILATLSSAPPTAASGDALSLLKTSRARRSELVWGCAPT